MAVVTLDIPLMEVVLVFNEKVEGAFSSIKVVNRLGKDMTTAKARVDLADATKLRLDISSFRSGTYNVR